jgi:hypothetical protein
MRQLPRPRLIAAVLAVVLVIAGVLVALFSGSERGKLDSSPAAQVAAARRQVTVAARYLGIPTPKLRRELLSGRSLAEVAEATGHSAESLVQALLAERMARLKDSQTLTPAQQQRLLADERRRLERTVSRRGPLVVISAGNLHTAAGYLGLSTTAVRGQLRRGLTLAHLASATPGRSSAGLVAALLAARQADLRSEAAAGIITDAQEARRLASLRTRITSIVNRPPLG